MHNVVFYVFGVAGLLALISFLPPLAKRLGVPYTVLLAVVGVVLGGTVQIGAGMDSAGPVGDFFRSLSGFDLSSETLLYLFLPILLFETALVVNVRRLLDDIGPILLLAVVAVFICTFAVGYALWMVSGFSLVACLLLGAILATTDPAAVIGIFRELGAPRRLTMLVEGESLLNDAAAIALFALLLGMITSHGAGGAMIAAGLFLKNFIGGMVVGYLCGRLVCLLVMPMHEQPMAEITLTVALAYLTFVLAEHYAGVSGVVAVVAAALVVGSVGRTRISPATWGALEDVWKQLGFWANSLIFLLAALVVPDSLKNVGWEHAGLLIVVILAAFGARAATLFGLVPVLSWLGLAHRVSGSYMAVMTWGGLRGAVSLALALAVTEKAGVPDRVQDFVAVLATGFVFFTLFVNGTTLRWLIRLLGLDKLTPVEAAMRNRALALSLTTVRERLSSAAHKYRLDEAASTALLDQYQQRLDAIDHQRAGDTPLSNDERVTIGLVILVNREEELYYHHFGEGIISRRVAELLGGRTAAMLDAVRTHGRNGYRAAETPFIAFSRWMRFASWMHRRFGMHKPLARRLAMRFEVLMGVRLVLGELIPFCEDRLSRVLGPDTAAELCGLMAVRVDEVEQALTALKLQYPDYALVLQNRYLGRAALRMEEADVRLLYSESIITEEVLSALKHDRSQRRKLLDATPQLDLKLELPELVGRVPIFSGLEPDRVAAIATLLKPRLVLPGEMIVRRGERGEAMFFIASGAVHVLVPGLDEPVKLGTGDFFGEMALLSRKPRNADVRAIGYCQLLQLDERDFRRFLQKDPDLRAHIQSVAEARRTPSAAPPTEPEPNGVEPETAQPAENP